MTEKENKSGRSLVGASVIFGYFIVLLFMLWFEKPGVDILIGGLVGYVAAVVQFHYGTSQGSEQKNVLLANSTPIVEGITTSRTTSQTTSSTEEGNMTDKRTDT